MRNVCLISFIHSGYIWMGFPLSLFDRKWVEPQSVPSRCQPSRQGYCGYCRVFYSNLNQVDIPHRVRLKCIIWKQPDFFLDHEDSSKASSVLKKPFGWEDNRWSCFKILREVQMLPAHALKTNMIWMSENLHINSSPEAELCYCESSCPVKMGGFLLHHISVLSASV